MVLRHRKKGKYKGLKNKKKTFILRIPDSEYAPNMDYLDYYRLQKYHGSVEVVAKYFSTISFVAYEKSDGNIFVTSCRGGDETIFCDYLHKNELELFFDSIKDNNNFFCGNYREVYDYEDIEIIEDISVSFGLKEIIGEYKVLICFDNGWWYPIEEQYQGDFIYNFRDELIDIISKKLESKIERPDLKLDIEKGIQKTVYDW